MRVLKEYNASDWKISEIDPETSGKYVFDKMEYIPGRGGRCQNCGQLISWLCFIHDAEDDTKRFVVGDDCIEFLLGLSSGLQNIEDLKNFRGAKKVLINFFHWMHTRHIDMGTLDGALGLVNKASNSSEEIAEFVHATAVDGFQNIPLTKDGRPLRPFQLHSDGFTMREWLQFYPKLKTVLVSYSNSDKPTGGFLASPDSHLLLQTELSDVRRRCDYSYYTLHYSDTPYEEKECQTKLGELKSIRCNTRQHLLTLDETLEYKSLYQQNAFQEVPRVCVWDQSVAAMFPECSFDMESFLTDSTLLQLMRKVCFAPVAPEVKTEIEQAREAQRKKEQEKKDAEDKKCREEELKVKTWNDAFDALETDPTQLFTGFTRHCVNDAWLSRLEAPIKDILKKKVAEARAKSKPGDTLMFALNNCQSKFNLRFKDQIQRLKSMDEPSQRWYLKNIVSKISDKYRIPRVWSIDAGNLRFNYVFQATGIKDLPNDEGAIVIGAVEVAISVNTSAATISENTRLTLTISQLKRLIRENFKV